MGYPPSPFTVIDVRGTLPKNASTQRSGSPACERVRACRRPTNNWLVSAINMENEMEFNKEFDASGLACPLPIVKTKKALADMTSGQVLRVISTDPGSVCDMAAFAEQTGNALLEQSLSLIHI